MVIAQITDIHIAPGGAEAHGVHVTANFRRVLEDVSRHGDVTHLVVTGDLCFEEPLLSTMKWVRGELEATGLPFFVIPGNHDDSVVMAQVFDLEHYLQSGELYYDVEAGGLHLIFLDTARGSLSADQLAWLGAVAQLGKLPGLVFMHHPPVDAVPYMDLNYALEDKAEVAGLLNALPRLQGVFCGHYHTGKTVNLPGGLPVHLTPSTFFQIDDTTPDFRVAGHDIAWRKIAVREGVLHTSLQWLPAGENRD